MELKDMITELNTAFAEFKQANDARIKAIESKGFAPADLVEKCQKLTDKMNETETKMDQIRTAMNRTTQTQEKSEQKSEAQEVYEQKLSGYLRGQVAEQEVKAAAVAYKAAAIEAKAMVSDIDEAGGFLISPERSSEVVKKIYESSPIRQLASVQTISSNELEILEDLDEAGSGWVGEIESRSETSTPTLKMIKIPVHELYAKPKATQRFLDDGQINVEAWLAEKVSDKFGRDEATAFVSGNGVKKPQGFLSYGAGDGFGLIEQIVSGAAATVTADAIVSMEYTLKEVYRRNAVWGMRRATIGVIRALKDSQNRYLWAPGLDGMSASTLAGFPIYEMADMPALGANNLSIVFGDFKQGYQIVDRLGIRTLRDPYSSKPYVEFYTTKRVGGGVKNFEALKIMKCST